MPGNNSQRQLDNHLTLHGWLNDHLGIKLRVPYLLISQDLMRDSAQMDAHQSVNFLCRSQI